MIADFATTVLEARFLAALQMKTTDENRKKRMNGLVSKVGEFSQQFNVDMKMKVFTRLLSSHRRHEQGVLDRKVFCCGHGVVP